MRLTRGIFFLIFLFFFNAAQSQDLDFGIRAGLNYSKFRGPSENGLESFSLDGGFHFGFNIRYNFSKYFALQSEFIYSQHGSGYDFKGIGPYVFPTTPVGRQTVIDSSLINLSISNAYISFPITAHFRPIDRWEFYAGAYIGFLVSPVANGKWIFGEIDADHAFEQRQDYNYSKDEVGEFNIFSNTIAIIVDGANVDLPGNVGAYYSFEEKDGSLFNSMDIGLAGGVNYFLNRGIYLGLRLDWGMRDLTNERMDISRTQLNEDGSFITRDDKDTHLGFNISMGFKF